MSGLKVFTSNRLEILGEQLAQIVSTPLGSPVSPEIIVVQSSGMQRWVSMMLATLNGVCANCAFPFPNAFLHDVFRRLMPDLSEESPFDPRVMTFKIMKALPACVDRPAFADLKTYLKGDTTGLKRFQVSQEIADTFDQYLVYRPEMIFAWEEGGEAHWQAQLWRELVGGDEKMHRAWLQKTLLEKIRRRPFEIDMLPERISIFGISQLPPFHMQAFAEISRLVQVYIFLMNPCREFWADIVSDKEIKRIKKRYPEVGHAEDELHLEKGNRLLASMGALGRDFFALIHDFDCEVDETFQESDNNTVLSQIQSDILNLRDGDRCSPSEDRQRIRGPRNATCESRCATASDASVQIHSCHSPMREIEVLYDHLLAMFATDPTLLPKDILVMTPDIELYAPFIRAVFDAQTDKALRIPFSIADQSFRKESRVIDGFLGLLEFKGSRLGVPQVMSLLESPGIRKKFDLSEPDLEIAENWINETMIRWGRDAESRAKLNLPAFPENTWCAGMERLLLGYAMPGRNHHMFAGILPYDHIEGGDVKVLGKLLEFLNRVFASADLLEGARCLRAWQVDLLAILDHFFHPDEDSEQEIQVIRRILDDLSRKQRQSGLAETVELEVVRAYIKSHVEREFFGTGFISGGVTFCAMLPMRSIPAQVICLIGMNVEAFPREDRTPGFNLMARTPKPGDRSRRSDDKYLFLEALISARQKLYISYVGQSIQDNTKIPPSVLVSELIDYIEDGFDWGEKQLITRHRLQAFSPAYFKGHEALFSYSEENLLASRSIYDPQNPRPFISTGLPAPSPAWQRLDIDTLCAFFSHPAKFLLQRRLNLYLGERPPAIEERENFQLDGIEKYLIGQDLVKDGLSGADLQNLLPLQRAQGGLPHGTVGTLVYNEMSLEADRFVNKVQELTRGKRVAPMEADLEIAGFHLVGRLAELYERGPVRLRYANTKPKDLLGAWIHHVVLGALIEEHPEITFGTHTCFLGKNTAWEFIPVENSRDILEHLLTCYWEGLSKPLTLFPESSYEYAQRRLTKNQSRQVALNGAQKKWTGNDFTQGESADPYYNLCFGVIALTDIMGEAFQRTAEDVFGPLLAHRTELIF